jgi:hypothetical protein
VVIQPEFLRLFDFHLSSSFSLGLQWCIVIHHMVFPLHFQSIAVVIKADVIPFMSIEQKITTIFAMTDEVWMRHANPWSVWTRYAALPILVLSIWSRVWIGWWSIIPIALSVIWIWINPRAFKKPVSTNNWASMAVLGERVWLHREAIAVPQHFEPVIRVLSILSSIGTLVCIVGLFLQSFWMTIFGIAVLILSKSWFLDRMVWLYQEMKGTDDEYRKWFY